MRYRTLTIAAVTTMIENLRRLVLGVVLSVVGALHAHAVPLDLIPNDLSLGDPYRLVFVTDTRYGSGSNNPAAENARVTTDANAVAEIAALGATWTAIVSTTVSDARDNTGTNPASTGVPIYLIDGNRVANDNGDLWDGTLLTSIGMTPSGVTTFGNSNKRVWTSTATDGTAANLFPNTVTIGFATDSNSNWIGGMPTGKILSGNDAKRLYAISSTLTAPEPSTLTLAALALLSLVACGRRRRRA